MTEPKPTAAAAKPMDDGTGPVVIRCEDRSGDLLRVYKKQRIRNVLLVGEDATPIRHQDNVQPQRTVKVERHSAELPLPMTVVAPAAADDAAALIDVDAIDQPLEGYFSIPLAGKRCYNCKRAFDDMPQPVIPVFPIHRDDAMRNRWVLRPQPHCHPVCVKETHVKEHRSNMNQVLARLHKFCRVWLGWPAHKPITSIPLECTDEFVAGSPRTTDDWLASRGRVHGELQRAPVIFVKTWLQEECIEDRMRTRHDRIEAQLKQLATEKQQRLFAEKQAKAAQELSQKTKFSQAPLGKRMAESAAAAAASPAPLPRPAVKADSIL